MVRCPTELGRGVIPSMVGLQLTKLSGNCSLHQHVVHHNSISCQKKTTFVGTHDWTFCFKKLFCSCVKLASAHWLNSLRLNSLRLNILQLNILRLNSLRLNSSPPPPASNFVHFFYTLHSILTNFLWSLCWCYREDFDEVTVSSSGCTYFDFLDDETAKATLVFSAHHKSISICKRKGVCTLVTKLTQCRLFRQMRAQCFNNTCVTWSSWLVTANQNWVRNLLRYSTYTDCPGTGAIWKFG